MLYILRSLSGQNLVASVLYLSRSEFARIWFGRRATLSNLIDIWKHLWIFDFDSMCYKTPTAHPSGWVYSREPGVTLHNCGQVWAKPQTDASKPHQSFFVLIRLHRSQCQFAAQMSLKAANLLSSRSLSRPQLNFVWFFFLLLTWPSNVVVVSERLTFTSEVKEEGSSTLMSLVYIFKPWSRTKNWTAL